MVTTCIFWLLSSRSYKNGSSLKFNFSHLLFILLFTLLEPLLSITWDQQEAFRALTLEWGKILSSLDICKKCFNFGPSCHVMENKIQLMWRINYWSSFVSSILPFCVRKWFMNFFLNMTKLYEPHWYLMTERENITKLDVFNAVF